MKEVDRPYHHGDLRRVVLETAGHMLREDKGWQFTLREVARRAGVSHAAPYKHFPDKQALLTELAIQGFEQLGRQMTAAVAPRPRSIRKELLTVGNAYVQFGVANPALYRLMFSSEAGDSSSVHLNERVLRTFAVLLDVLERGQHAGAFREASGARTGSCLLGASARSHDAVDRRVAPARKRWEITPSVPD